MFASCNSKWPEKGKIIKDNQVLEKCNEAIKNAIVLDRISPPVASRRYYYANVAAFEALVPFFPDYISFAGQFKELSAAPKPDTTLGYCLDLVSAAAHSFVSQKLVYQEDTIENFRKRLISFYKANLHPTMFKNSISFGDSVGAHIVKWAKKDSFAQTRSMPQWNPTGKNGAWEPTGPEFKEGIEPHWQRIRTAVVSNPFEVPIDNPIESYWSGGTRNREESIGSIKNSPAQAINPKFLQLNKEVLEVSKKLTDSLLAIAKYWDDNPNSTEHFGHVTINHLKISPGGHWINLFGNVADQKKFGLMQLAEGYARMSAVIHDAFIICWAAKYKTDYVRPYTSVRALLDSTFTPTIVTPPFPEYPSGHSVVSQAAAALLTHFFGIVEFEDRTEAEFGLGTRKFSSFRAAADQACISRLYGGIHFREAIEKGAKMGRDLAELHIKRVKTKK